MKKLNILINSCKECPYCHYNGDYGRSYDSGYDCTHPDRDINCNYKGRIVDDWDVDNPNNPKPKGFPNIPDWCPLPDFVA